MSRNSKQAKRNAGIGGYGTPGQKRTQPKHEKKKRSTYNTADRSGFPLPESAGVTIA